MKLSHILESTSINRRATFVLPAFIDVKHADIDANLFDLALSKMKNGSWINTKIGKEGIAKAQEIADRWQIKKLKGEDFSIVKNAFDVEANKWIISSWIDSSAVIAGSFPEVSPVKKGVCTPRECYNNALQYVKKNPESQLILGFITSSKAANQPSALTEHAFVKHDGYLDPTSSKDGLILSWHPVKNIPYDELPQDDFELMKMSQSMSKTLDAAAKEYIKKHIPLDL